MQPTLADIYRGVRAKLNDEAAANGQVFTNERLSEAVRDAIDTLYDNLQSHRVPLGQLDVVLNIPANQGYLDPRSFGVTNIGAVERIWWRTATNVSGTPHKVSANDVYGVNAPEGGWGGDAPMAIGVMAPGANVPPTGAQVIVVGSGAHGLTDGAQVVISPDIVSVSGMRELNPAMHIAGLWSALAYDTTNFALQGARVEFAFENLPVVATTSNEEFKPISDMIFHRNNYPTTTTDSLSQVAVVNEVLMWQPLPTPIQIRIEYRASAEIPQLSSMKIPINGCRKVLTELATAYALGTETPRGRAYYVMALGPNLGVGGLGGSMWGLIGPEVRNAQRRAPEVIGDFRPSWGPHYRAS